MENAISLMLCIVAVLCFNKFDTTGKAKYCTIGVISLFVYACMLFADLIRG